MASFGSLVGVSLAPARALPRAASDLILPRIMLSMASRAGPGARSVTKTLLVTLVVYGHVLVAMAFLLAAVFGTGGALGLAAGLGLAPMAVLLSAPGMLLSCLVLALVLPRHGSRVLSAAACSATSAAAMVVVTAILTAQGQPGPDPIDLAPLNALMTIFAALNGLIAGSVAVAVHEVLGRPTRT